MWLGTSVENNRWAAERIPALSRTSARTLFLSCEPLLEQVDLTPWLPYPRSSSAVQFTVTSGMRPVDWVIVGGESGPKARPMNPAWVRSLRDQCVAAGVPFFFKQWGEWAPTGEFKDACSDPREELVGEPDVCGLREVIRRVGKKQAGNVLDGQTWAEFPKLPQPPTAR